MQIQNDFIVTAPLDEVWTYLLDVEKIAPCMPGAELTETVDGGHWKGKLSMKFGPVSMSFAGSVEMKERDDEAHRVVLGAKGMEQKGKGAATATVTSWMEPGATDGETAITMVADITLTGAAAQLSRGLLPEISKKLTQQFADCLQANMNAEQQVRSAGDGTVAAAPPAPVPAAVAEPVGGVGTRSVGDLGEHPDLLPTALRGRVEDVVSGVVLAAGEGRRFGGTKQLEPIDGRPLVQHAVDALVGGHLDEIVVVTGHDAARVETALALPANGRIVRDPDHRDGQASSLAAGIGALDGTSEGAVILMGDQPGITATDVRALAEGFRTTGRPIVRLRFTDGPGPALLGRRVFPEASELTGDVGARALIAAHPGWVAEVAIDRPQPVDIDRRSDLPRERGTG